VYLYFVTSSCIYIAIANLDLIFFNDVGLIYLYINLVPEDFTFIILKVDKNYDQ
jgi:hypothetical protein